MTEWLESFLPTWLFEDGQFTVLGKILFSMLVIFISYFVIKLIMFLLKRLFGVKKRGIAIDKSAKNFFIQTIKIALWLAASFVVIQILGLSVTSFAGVISAVTVALSLSLQDIIKCFASGLIILNQKHYVTGDMIEINNAGVIAEGEVYNIALMSTTIKNFNGQYISISNNTMRDSIITNFTKNGVRRIVYKVGVSYDCDTSKVKEVLLDIAKNDEKILKDPAPNCHLSELGNFRVEVTIKLWTKVSDYWDTYNEMHEKVLLAFRKNNIHIQTNTELTIKNK